MARLPRLALAGHLHHLIHRGHNLQPIVVDDEDRKALLAALQDSAATHKVAIHAYVVMPNHLHLLATPSTTDGLTRLMQALGRRSVSASHLRHRRVTEQDVLHLDRDIRHRRPRGRTSRSPYPCPCRRGRTG